MSMNKKTIFLIVGQTASGKDSLVNLMCQNFKLPMTDIFGKWSLHPYKQLISYATRPRRENEGDTHIFIQPNEVEQYKDQIVAYTKQNVATGLCKAGDININQKLVDKGYSKNVAL